MDQYDELREKARLIRRHIVEMVAQARSGHPGGSLSAVEILTALYFRVMRIDPARPDWEDRDRFILSKGHASPVLYATLAERGFFPVAELGTFRRLNSRLQGHPARHKLPGVEAASGSLGQGLSFGVGTALAGRLDGRDYRTYVLLGDGEVQEGQVWEAAMAAAHYRLDNLTAFIDFNGLQIDGPVDQVMKVSPLDGKFEAFGWKVRPVDGHDFGQLFAAIEWARQTRGRPTLILARTVKGRGVSYMENQVGWHGTAPDAGQVEQALRELGGGVGNR